MKILLLGNKRSIFCSEVYYLRTFQDMGHEVIFLQESEASGLDIIANSKGVDCFFWVSTHGWKTHGIEMALQWLKERGIVTFGFHLDLYVGLERWKEYSAGKYIAQLDHFFTVDKNMAEWLCDNTQTQGHFLPAGVYEGECGEGIVNKEKYPYDIIFTGAKLYHREWPYRQKLIDWLHETYGDKFGHYGNGGGLAQVRGKDLNDLYTSAKVVIGDTLCKDFSYEFYSSDRLYESLGRNAFLIYPRIKGLELFYQDKREVVYYDFNNFEQLKTLIDYYLEHQDEANVIRANGLRRTKEAHTYRHRFESIFTTLNLNK